MTGQLRWGDDHLRIEARWTDASAPSWSAVESNGVSLGLPDGLAIGDVLVVGAGHEPASDRLVHSAIAPQLRYESHEDRTDRDGVRELRLTTRAGSLVVDHRLRTPGGVGAFRSEVEVRNDGAHPVVLQGVPSWASYLGEPGSASMRDWTLHTASSDWLGENRWRSTPLDADAFPQLAAELTGWSPRGELRFVSTGTWSTGRFLPVGVLESARTGSAWGWQVEHNGPWRFEVGEDSGGAYLALSGPTDADAQWTRVLAPGESFRSVPATVAVGRDHQAVVDELTRYRRATRRRHPDNERLSVVFNDYMNTLNGAPAAEKLLPLIAAAAAAGAGVFCLGAGWYDDGPWWDSVGAWEPAGERFPGGLQRVLERIRDAGMVPGLWLEPEVVGINSPVARSLPDDAFLSRHGVRIVEHSRYVLDLAHPAAVDHLDRVVDRIVGAWGVGYLKLDYNVDPGAGTDRDADSAGDGLLRHNRAHLAWLDAVLDRHPDLVLENCGSGAMRADPAMLARMQLQSTSDQQDFRRYPVIAASAPMSMLPEQAASWAYPQPGMSEEEVAFCLVTGLLGRFFLSGHLDLMDRSSLALVTEAVALAKSIRSVLPQSLPRWPLGLPGWDDEWVALSLETPEQTYLAVWNRSDGGVLELPVPPSSTLRPVFPTTLTPWRTATIAPGTIRLTNPTGRLGARLFAVEPTEHRGA
ncbi:glycoside hydrolase family 36 protein [uncultured Amnibacterium sp.]|uniref:glycoside hydrolase family 36 protein n=1 Tax=uncultured Amnibacterium sp. TaxID=1631851 RepID=UPI0035CC0C04